MNHNYRNLVRSGGVRGYMASAVALAQASAPVAGDRVEVPQPVAKALRRSEIA